MGAHVEARASFCVIKYCESKPDACEEATRLLMEDTVQSRKEEGNVRFDLLVDTEDSSKMVAVIYYTDEWAYQQHFTTPHYKEFAAFEKEGNMQAVDSSIYRPVNLQAKGKPVGDAPLVVSLFDVQVKASERERFLGVMDKLIRESREQEGCLHLDLTENIERENNFFFYNVLRDSEAVAASLESATFREWYEYTRSEPFESELVQRWFQAIDFQPA